MKMQETLNETVVTGRSKKRQNETWRRFKKNRLAMAGLVVFCCMVVIAFVAPYIAPYGIDEQDYNAILESPSWGHLFGTDKLGRDLFSRIIIGSRMSLFVGIISVGISLLVGGAIGVTAGYFGGKVDLYIMRFIDVIRAIPSIIIAIVISAVLGSGLFNTMIACGFMNIPAYALIPRSSIMAVKNQEFVEAAIAIGANKRRIIFRHVIPNALSPTIIQVSQGLANSVLMISMLSFLGLGVQPPNPEWGALLSAGRDYLRSSPYLCLFPGLAIATMVFSINLMGDGIRDALDPKLKR